MKKIYFIIAGLTVSLLSGLLFFTDLDLRLHDLFLATKPSLIQNEKFYVLKIDKNTVNEIGTYPFSRDIFSECNLLFKEMDVNSVVYDIDFSPKSNSSDFLIESSSSKSITSPDENFSKSIALCANVILASRLLESDLSDEKDVTSEDLLANRFFFPITRFQKELKLPVYKKIAAPINIFSNYSNALGFVNKEFNKDGKVREVPLFLNYYDHYYPQLMIAALLNFFGNPDFEVTKNSLIIKNVKIDEGYIKNTKSKKSKSHETSVNIKIPLSKNGNLILKYPKKQYSLENSISFLYAYNILKQEKKMINQIERLNQYDFFSGVPEDSNPYLKMKKLLDSKKDLFSNNEDLNNSDENLSSYLNTKIDFYDSIANYISGNYISYVFELHKEEDLNSLSESLDDLADLYNKILDAKSILKSKIKDTILIIGASDNAIEEGSLFYRTDKNYISDVEIQQTIANMIYYQDFTDNCPWYVSFILALILCVTISIVAITFKKKRQIILTGLFTLFMVVFVEYIIFLITSLYIGLLVPFTSIILLIIFLLLIDFYFDLRRAALRNTLYEPHTYAENILNDNQPEQTIEIENPKKELQKNVSGIKNLSILCTEIPDFAKMQETFESEPLFKYLNQYNSSFVDSIKEYNGHIESFSMNEMCSYFGLVSTENQAQDCCNVALQIKKLEEEINGKNKNVNLSVFTRMGIFTDEMYYGYVSETGESNGAPSGSNIFYAKQLREINKIYNTKGIVICENTKIQAGNDFLYRKLDIVRFSGIDKTVRLYELISKEKTPELETFTEQWEKAINLFNQRQYNEALVEFTELSKTVKDDGVVHFYIKRCNNYINNPPSINWDGIVNLKSN